MMSSIAFVTDSTAYIPPELVAKYDIKVAPQVLIWGDEQMRDGVDITPAEFYARLKTADVMPTTSQVAVVSFKEILEPLAAANRPVVMILVSDEISKTLQSAAMARDMVQGAKVEIIDSRSIAMAMGFQVLAAARAAEAGKSFEEVVTLAKKAKEHTGVLFVVDTLEFLHRGGRIGGARKLLGTAVKIKPLLELQDGRIEALENIRTKAKALARMLDVLEERIAGRTPVRLSAVHAAAEDEARDLLEQAVKRFHPVEAVIADASPVVGTHAGPGTVALAYSAGL
jgi:DegV family protein with EDD domain